MMSFVNTVNYTETVVVSGPFSTTTQFRFRSVANGNLDYVYLDRINISGCEDVNESSRLATKNSTSTSELSIINLFPNPASNDVNIEYTSKNEGKINLSIYHTTGQLLLSKTTSAQEGKNIFKADLNVFKTGVYIVEIKNGKNKSTKKLTIIK